MLKRLASRIVLFAAFAYPAALLLVILLLRFVGEHWWVTAVALYLPRLGFALPLPLIVLALLTKRELRRRLWTQALAAVLILFPLMGFVVPSCSLSAPSGPKLRVLSLNANQGYTGAATIVPAIRSLDPDIVIMQELVIESKNVADALKAFYPTVETNGQFLIATRSRLVRTHEPKPLGFYGRARSPRFLRYDLDTVLGPLTLYSVHPLSPREVFYMLRGKGLRREIATGHVLSGEADLPMRYNSALRELQIRTVAELAGRENGSVLIAGDTNLPELSPVLASTLGRYRDGFQQAGSGFGYTFPTKFPWMRIDRMRASDSLRFTDFAVGCRGVSDHLCIYADLVKAAP